MSNIDTFSTEYLVIIDKKTSGAYFKLINSPAMLNQLIQNESEISIQGNKIIFNKENFEYKIRHGVVSEKEQRYFYISILTKKDDFSNYSKLLRELKKSVMEQKFIVETLQDDVSFFYSKRAYSMIHEIENLMRKFITFFMIANVGKDWVFVNTPSQVKKALDRCKPRGDYASELQKLDFKDLGYFLFDTYQVNDNSSLYKIIDSYQSISDVNIRDLKLYVPRSNWNIYFKKHIDIDGSSLEKKWEKLYELRNSVAHTSSLNRDKYEEIKDLVDEVKPILNKAFDSLGKLKLDASERIAISEKIVTTLDNKVGVYFNEINNLEEEIRSLAPNMGNMPLDKFLNYLLENDLISSSTNEKIIKLIQLKGSVSFDSIPSNENINQLADKINELQSTIQDTWSKEVYLSIIRLGGRSSLNGIYRNIQENTNRNLFGSWKTSVRRAIYSHSSDVELYNGKYDIYKQISKGIWMIRKDIDSKTIEDFLGGFD